MVDKRRSPWPLVPRPRWLTRAAWPFDTVHIDGGGCRIAVTDAGSGPTILFVHTGLWSFIWRDVMLALSSDFRCICLDAPGTGLSGRPPERLSLELSAAAVVNVLEQLDLSRVTLVCHDLGGISGFAGAARESHRVERLVAVNALAWRPHTWSLRSALAVFGSAAIREADALTHLVPRITSTTFGIGRHLDPPSRRVFLESFDRDRIRAFHAYLRDALRCDALYAEIERAIDGPLAALPLQTIFGERNDPFHFQEQWRARYPDVVRCVLGHGNHFPMCDDPPRVAAWIRDRHRATRSSTVAAGTI